MIECILILTRSRAYRTQCIYSNHNPQRKCRKDSEVWWNLESFRSHRSLGTLISRSALMSYQERAKGTYSAFITWIPFFPDSFRSCSDNRRSVRGFRGTAGNHRSWRQVRLRSRIDLGQGSQQVDCHEAADGHDWFLWDVAEVTKTSENPCGWSLGRKRSEPYIVFKKSIQAAKDILSYWLRTPSILGRKSKANIKLWPLKVRRCDVEVLLLTKCGRSLFFINRGLRKLLFILNVSSTSKEAGACYSCSDTWSQGYCELGSSTRCFFLL